MNFCDKDGNNCWKCEDKNLQDSDYIYKCKCKTHYYLSEPNNSVWSILNFYC